jgi:hypothetical protein
MDREQCAPPGLLNADDSIVLLIDLQQPFLKNWYPSGEDRGGLQISSDVGCRQSRSASGPGRASCRDAGSTRLRCGVFLR